MGLNFPFGSVGPQSFNHTSSHMMFGGQVVYDSGYYVTTAHREWETPAGTDGDEGVPSKTASTSTSWLTPDGAGKLGWPSKFQSAFVKLPSAASMNSPAFISQAGANWDKVGGVSAEGLFRPFSTEFASGDPIDHYTTADVQGNEVLITYPKVNFGKMDAALPHGSHGREDHVGRPSYTHPPLIPSGYMPSFEMPTDKIDNRGTLIGSGVPTSLTLNPFASGHDISHVMKDCFIPEHGASVRKGGYGERAVKLGDIPDAQGYCAEDPSITDRTTCQRLGHIWIGNPDGCAPRPMGLRGPLVVVGWGYDTEGRPVPNAELDADYKTIDGHAIHPPSAKGHKPAQSGVNSFMPNHMKRFDKWKAGPVDLRWDRDRKVWAAAGGGTEVFLCKSVKCILPNTYADGQNSFTKANDGYHSNRQYKLDCPGTDCEWSNYFPLSTRFPEVEIVDPEDSEWDGVCDKVNNNVSCGDLSQRCKPFFDGYIIRKMANKPFGDCSDKFIKGQFGKRLGNPCDGFKDKEVPTTLDSKALDVMHTKIFVENPLQQGIDVGDIFYSVDTGREIEHVYYKKSKDDPKIRQKVSEKIKVHAIIQAEFYSAQFVVEATCEEGEMSRCNRKIFLQGFSTTVDCGPDDDYF